MKNQQFKNYINLSVLCCKSFLECFVRRDVLEKTPLHEIDYENINNCVPLEEMYLGAKVAISIDSLNNTDKAIFRQRCKDFYIEAAKQICQRFDFQDPVLININLLSIENILNKKKMTALCHLSDTFQI